MLPLPKKFGLKPCASKATLLYNWCHSGKARKGLKGVSLLVLELGRDFCTQYGWSISL